MLTTKYSHFKLKNSIIQNNKFLSLVEIESMSCTVLVYQTSQTMSSQYVAIEYPIVVNACGTCSRAVF